ncbi:MAG TPA: acetyl-CoA carboxylase biotin carboxyl carrier protein subunit [Fimbriimonadaceae bacterium]|nr:acetyl-CoA carboxylase biotin carboxyl carrier protein subunit [Fimbriimonadaceae bacterium]
MSSERLNERVDELAALMNEFGLAEAELRSDDWKISLKKTRLIESSNVVAAGDTGHSVSSTFSSPAPEAKPSVQGTPVTSPMTGIFYSAPSPNAPPFIKEGEPVTAGQVVGLIEAMKVFNEINAPISGTVTLIAADNGAIVNPGDPLLYIS